MNLTRSIPLDTARIVPRCAPEAQDSPVTHSTPLSTLAPRRVRILALITAAVLVVAGVILGTANDATAASVSPSAGKTRSVALSGSSAGSARFQFDREKMDGGSLYLQTHVRSAAASTYLVQARVFPSGAVSVSLKRKSAGDTTTLVRSKPTKLTVSAKAAIAVSLSASGSNPVKLTGKVKVGSSTFTVSFTDRSASRVRAGGDAKAAVYAGSTSKRVVKVTITDRRVTTSAAPQPTPTATPKPKPTATATPSPKPTASPKPTPKPTATAKPSPTPTASAAPRPSPTPTASEAPRPSGDRPDATNTGVPRGTKLTRYDGDLEITKANTVIDGLEVHGVIKVRAAGVVIKNTKVIGPSTSGRPLVSNYPYGHSFTITDSELWSTTPSPYANGILGSNFTALRVNVHDVIDTVHITGGNVTVRDSYLHDTLHYKNDPVQKNGPSHDDVIQVQGGSNIVIEGNTLAGSTNTVIMVTQDQSRLSGLTIRGNYIDGGNCSINMNEKGKGPLKNVLLQDNLFGPNRAISYCAAYIPPASDVTLRANYWEATGKIVAPVFRE